MKKYFHLLTEKDFKQLVDEHKTWGDIMQEYQQPDWCTYPEALGGIWGCWSLTDRSIKLDETFCSNCDCYKAVNNKLMVKET